MQANIITAQADIDAILRGTKTIAVLGIKPESHAAQPAFYVPQYMSQHGYEIIPVPVYYPEVTEILGRPIYRKLIEISGPVDGECVSPSGRHSGASG
jgi:predicted CoA-binding protein